MGYYQEPSPLRCKRFPCRVRKESDPHFGFPADDNNEFLLRNTAVDLPRMDSSSSYSLASLTLEWS